MNELESMAARLNNGERLDREEGIWLFKNGALLETGMLAEAVKRKKTGSDVFFNVNKHINLTNICMSRCRFCAFGRGADHPEAYAMTVEEALAYAQEAPPDITELHIVSALHPDLPFEYYVEVLSRLRDAFPGVHLQAFTAVEIDYFSRISGSSIEEVLRVLQDAGLGSMPGGGAEILNGRVRETACPKKADSQRWLEVMETAHGLGIKTNATMLYGHIESIEERVDHLLALREIQDRTGGFQSFIPLAFHPENTEWKHLQRTSGLDDLKTMAVSRLLLDNFDHVKAFWIMLGVQVAQLALLFGADDLDGTVVEERITHAAGAKTDVGITREKIVELIHEAGFDAVERDTLYNVVRRYPGR